MSKTCLVALMLIGLAAPAAAAEGSLERDMQRMGEEMQRDMQRMGKQMEGIAREAAEDFLATFGKMIERMPQYGLPEMNENGDIVIPRREPAPRNDPEDTTDI